MTAPASKTPVQELEFRQKVFAGLGLLILLSLAIILNTLHLNSVAEQSTKFISRMIQLQEFREVGLTLMDAKLDSFAEIHYRSDRPGRSFDLPAKSTLTDNPGFFDALTTERVTVPTANPLNSAESDYIVYIYNRFQMVPYAAMIWLIIVLIAIPQTRAMKQRVIQQYERELSLERDRAQAAVAKEVRHNLRSPLAALMRIPARLPDSVKKDRVLLTSTINQIKALIARLGQDKDVEFSQKASFDLYDSIFHSVQEIALAIPPEIQFLPEIDEGLISAQVRHIPHELRALLGNIVSNSIDAIDGNGVILFRASDMASDIEIEIKDSGRGIPQEIIGKIFDDGFSSKDKSLGLGLFHAKRYIDEWGGSIHAESNGFDMTTITIRLPVDERTSWYVPRIRVQQGQPIFVVEDQESARELWRLRLDEAGLSNVQILSSPEEFRRAVSGSKNPNDLRPAYFFDYELANGTSGLDLFSEVPPNSDKYLVTGHFDDLRIRKRCEKENVLLLPKSQLSDVPIVVV